jgi:hypothetical protein
MMKQEFEERANFKISLECYHSLIEPDYNASKLDKDEWVKEWKKNGGIQAAYDWEKKRANTCQKGNKALTEESIEMDEKLAEQTHANMRLAEYLIEKGTQYSDSEMLNKAKGILGEKAYITYKLEKNIELTDEDKKFILANLK